MTMWGFLDHNWGFWLGVLVLLIAVGVIGLVRRAIHLVGSLAATALYLIRGYPLSWIEKEIARRKRAETTGA